MADRKAAHALTSHNATRSLLLGRTVCGSEGDDVGSRADVGGSAQIEQGLADGCSSMVGAEATDLLRVPTVGAEDIDPLCLTRVGDGERDLLGLGENAPIPWLTTVESFEKTVFPAALEVSVMLAVMLAVKLEFFTLEPFLTMFWIISFLEETIVTVHD